MSALPTSYLARSHCLFLWLLPALLLFSRALADATVVSVGLLFLLRSYRQKDWGWLQQPWFRLALVFWGYLICINLPMSQLPDESLKNVLAFIRWPVFAAALAYWILATRAKQGVLLKGLILTCLFVILDTSWQYMFGKDWFGIEEWVVADHVRLTGPFRSPVPGTLMLRVWFIACFALLFWQWKKADSRLRLASFATVLVSGFLFIFITGERMALLLYSLASILLLTAMVIEYRASIGRTVFVVLLVFLSLLMLVIAMPESTQQRIWSISDKLANFRDSDYGQVFSAAWQVWQAHLWLGTGLDNYQVVCEQMGVLEASKAPCSHPHNLYLELGAETGLVGVVLFLCLLVAIYRAALGEAIQTRAWLHVSLSVSVLTVSFWPLTGGISPLSNWVGALVWLGVGWALAISATPLRVPTPQIADPTD